MCTNFSLHIPASSGPVINGGLVPLFIWRFVWFLWLHKRRSLIVRIAPCEGRNCWNTCRKNTFAMKRNRWFTKIVVCQNRTFVTTHPRCVKLERLSDCRQGLSSLIWHHSTQLLHGSSWTNIDYFMLSMRFLMKPIKVELNDKTVFT